MSLEALSLKYFEINFNDLDICFSTEVIEIPAENG